MTNTTVNFMDKFAEFVGQQIKRAKDGEGVHTLYKSLATAHITREIFVFVYHGLVRTRQIDALEDVPQEKKDEIWQEVINATRDMENQHKSGVARTNLARCIYLIKIAIEP